MASNGIAELLAVLATVVASEEEGRKEVLTLAAKHVQKEAKSYFGHYQDQAGPNPAWPQLAEATQDTRAKLGYAPNEPLLRDGKLRDSIDIEVDGHHAYVGSEDEVMLYQELGTSKIPPRPVLASAAFNTADEVADIIGDHLFKLFGG
jgi:phage gpG-like protein